MKTYEAMLGQGPSSPESVLILITNPKEFIYDKMDTDAEEIFKILRENLPSGTLGRLEKLFKDRNND